MIARQFYKSIGNEYVLLIRILFKSNYEGRNLRHIIRLTREKIRINKC